MRPQRKSDVLGNRQLAKQGIVLEHKAHLTVMCQAISDVGAAVAHAACVGVLQAGNNTKQRALAGARRTQQSEQRSLRHVQADVVESKEFAETLGEVVNGKAHGEFLRRNPSARAPGGDSHRGRVFQN